MGTLNTCKWVCEVLIKSVDSRFESAPQLTPVEEAAAALSLVIRKGEAVPTNKCLHASVTGDFGSLH